MYYMLNCSVHIMSALSQKSVSYCRHVVVVHLMFVVICSEGVNDIDTAADTSTCHPMARNRRSTKPAKQQSDLQYKLIMGGLCAALMLFLAIAWSLGSLDKLVSTLVVCLNCLIIVCLLVVK